MRANFQGWLRDRQARTQPMPIGVEFASDALQMVQCERREGRLLIRAATAVAYPGSRDILFGDRKVMRRFVKEAMASAPFKGRRVHTTLPASDVRIVPLSIAGLNTQNPQAAVIKALREKLRSDLSSEVIDYITVRSASAEAAEANILAAVARRDAVLTHLQWLEDLGLQPASVDVRPAALARLLANIESDEREQALLLINFGLEKTYITALWGKRLMLDREVQFGKLPLLSRLASGLGVDQEIALSLLQKPDGHACAVQDGLFASDAGRIIDEVLHAQFAVFAEEVSRTLVYIASKTRGSSTRHIYLNGSLAHYPYIQKRVQNLLEVPVLLLDPLSIFPAAGRSSFNPELIPTNGIALATGLAMRG